VVEFLQRCREAGAIEEDTYRRLAGKFERGVPEWGDIRFSVWLNKDGVVVVRFEPRDPQSFSKAVELLRGLGLRDRCDGEWCLVHFTAREPRGGGKGHVLITADGLRYIGWLALHGEGEAKVKARWLKEMLLKEAERKGGEVRRRLGQEGREATVEKEAKFFKSGGRFYGYVIIHADAEGGREADYIHTAAVLKVLGVEKWNRKKISDTTHRVRPRCADETRARVRSAGHMPEKQLMRAS
jgi:hypothetical protein